MIAYTPSLPSVFVKQLHTKARIRTKAGGCGVEPHTQTAFGSLLPPRGATQKLELCPRQQKTTRLLLFIRVYKVWNTQIYTNIGIRRSISIFLCSMRLNNCRWELLP